MFDLCCALDVEILLTAAPRGVGADWLLAQVPTAGTLQQVQLLTLGPPAGAELWGADRVEVANSFLAEGVRGWRRGRRQMPGRNVGTRGKIQRQTGTWLKEVSTRLLLVSWIPETSPYRHHISLCSLSLPENGSLYPSLFSRTFPLR